MGLDQAKKETTNVGIGRESSPISDNASKILGFLSHFIKAKKDLSLYPPTNPVVRESIEQMMDDLQNNFKTEGMVEVVIEKDHLLSGNEVIGQTDDRIEGFCLSLYRRGIHKLTLDCNISFDEIMNLLEVVNTDAEVIEAAGGIQTALESRGIAGAFVEGNADLTIMDGANLEVPEYILEDIPDVEDDDLNFDDLGTVESFGHLFIRVENGDIGGVKRLRALLGNPTVFSQLLEKSAFQLKKIEGEIDPTTRVEKMLEILQNVGAAIAALPSKDERTQLVKNLAVSVLGLSAGLRTELVGRGLVPKLAQKSLEAKLLSRFPVSQLADALMQDFEVSGAAVSVMESYFHNLELNQPDRSGLASMLHSKLDETNGLTPEVEALLKDKAREKREEKKDRQPQQAQWTPMVHPDTHAVKGYPPEKVLFKGDERERLKEDVTRELKAPVTKIMAPVMLEILRQEETPVNHANIINKISLYVDQFMAEEDYENASVLIAGLQDELEAKKEKFSETQLKPLREALGHHLGPGGIKRLIADFGTMDGKSPEFKKSVGYLSDLGPAAATGLLGLLEAEESRHVRLLICQALVQLCEDKVETLGKNIFNSQWYVVRNVVSILGQIGSPECVQYLRQGLSHNDIRVRKEAVKGLAKVRNEEAIGLLCKCATDNDPDTCKTALGWIAAIGTEQALPTVSEILSDERIWAAKDDVLRLAIEALGSMKSNEDATALLDKLARKRSIFKLRKAAVIREAAIAAGGGK